MVHLPAWLALSIHIFLIPAGCPKVNNALDREGKDCHPLGQGHPPFYLV